MWYKGEMIKIFTIKSAYMMSSPMLTYAFGTPSMITFGLPLIGEPFSEGLIFIVKPTKISLQSLLGLK